MNSLGAINFEGCNIVHFWGDVRLFIAQISGIGRTIAFSAVMTFLIIKVMELFIDNRIESSVEVEGLDVAKHGETAYPAFSGLD